MSQKNRRSNREAKKPKQNKPKVMAASEFIEEAGKAFRQ